MRKRIRKAAGIKKAVSIAGGQSGLAQMLKVTPQAVQQWEKNGKPPAERVLDIENALLDPDTSKPRVTRHELRPDLYPVEA